METPVKPITPETKFKKNDSITLPINFIPLFRSTIAIQNGVEKNLLFKTWGGLGDQICAEPTLRYALKHFRGCNISLASEKPELFKHLPFDNVIDINEATPNWDKYFVFETITPPNDTNLVWQFFSHMLTNCVDFPSLCALRSQLPIEEREILLSPTKPFDPQIKNYAGYTLVHAGRHWPSKTFPKDWWDNVLSELVASGLTPVLIGANTDDNRGTVDVETTGCVDLRNKTSVNDIVWLCQRAKVLLTNDSSPLHMSASRDPNDPLTGRTHIGYIATCKHPDFITHWRRPPADLFDKQKLEFANVSLRWQWREENLGLGGMWDIINHCPNNKEEITVDQVDESILREWLPDPKDVRKWVVSKFDFDEEYS